MGLRQQRQHRLHVEYAVDDLDYLTAGNITGKVTVTGGTATGNATTTVTVTAVVVPSYTITLAASPATVVAGGASTLTASVTAVNAAPTPTLYSWDCDNNGSIDFTSSTPSTTCTYLTAGNITGKVTVTGGTASGSATTTVIVTPVVLPLFTNSGTGNMVFTMPTSVSRIHIVGAYPGASSNFVVSIGGQNVINEMIGTSQTPMVSDGVYLTTGGLVQITLSSGVAWTFTEVR